MWTKPNAKSLVDDLTDLQNRPFIPGGYYGNAACRTCHVGQCSLFCSASPVPRRRGGTMFVLPWLPWSQVWEAGLPSTGATSCRKECWHCGSDGCRSTRWDLIAVYCVHRGMESDTVPLKENQNSQIAIRVSSAPHLPSCPRLSATWNLPRGRMRGTATDAGTSCLQPSLLYSTHFPFQVGAQHQ